MYCLNFNVSEVTCRTSKIVTNIYKISKIVPAFTYTSFEVTNAPHKNQKDKKYRGRLTGS